MILSNDNLFLEGLTGSAKNMTVRRLPGNRSVVSARSRGSKKKPTELQLDVRDQFKASIEYANGVKADPAKLAVYVAKVKPGRSPFNLMVKDFSTPPYVKSITHDRYTGQAGQSIHLQAYDDFKVVLVEVIITDAAGQVIEQGNALSRGTSRDWTYTTTVVNNQLPGTKISAIATDIPGNTGVLDVVL